MIVYTGIGMHAWEIDQYKKAFEGNYEICMPGFQRCFFIKEKARAYSKPPYDVFKLERKAVLFVILWESKYDYLIWNNPKHYKYHTMGEVLLNDGCRY